MNTNVLCYESMGQSSKDVHVDCWKYNIWSAGNSVRRCREKRAYDGLRGRQETNQVQSPC